jgi:NAD(P)-dependent dehydrogenase (short-subunit alcohol dehydrogenase family)
MRALITGGTRGLGLEIARNLQSRGDEVWVTGRSAPAPDFEFGDSLITADFTSRQGISEVANFIDRLQFDILVNNAGINRVCSIEELSDSDFEDVHMVNLRAPLHLMQAALAGMKIRRYGRIVNVTSIWGHKGRSGRVAYAASKFALRGLTAAAAAEVAPFGILVNSVAPGFVDTELTRSVLGEKGAEEAASLVPMRRLAQAEEIAHAVAWLTSPENTYMTGQDLIVDGGFLRA